MSGFQATGSGAAIVTSGWLVTGGIRRILIMSGSSRAGPRKVGSGCSMRDAGWPRRSPSWWPRRHRSFTTPLPSWFVRLRRSSFSQLPSSSGPRRSLFSQLPSSFTQDGDTATATAMVADMATAGSTVVAGNLAPLRTEPRAQTVVWCAHGCQGSILRSFRFCSSARLCRAD